MTEDKEHDMIFIEFKYLRPGHIVLHEKPTKDGECRHLHLILNKECKASCVASYLSSGRKHRMPLKPIIRPSNRLKEIREPWNQPKEEKPLEDQLQLPNPNDEASWCWDQFKQPKEEKSDRGMEIIDLFARDEKSQDRSIRSHLFPLDLSSGRQEPIKEAEDLTEGGYSKLMRSLTGQEPSINSLGIITAENPRAKKLPSHENKSRNRSLADVLRQAGYGFYQIQGKYGNIEKPYVIPNVSRKDILSLGEKFEQESVIFVERDGDQMRAEMLYTDESGREPHVRSVVLPVSQDQDDFFSTYKGRRFVIPFFDDFFSDAKMKGGRIVKEGRENRLKVGLREMLFEQVDGFDFFDSSDLFDSSDDVVKVNPDYENFINLDSGEKFSIGNKKPIYRVFGKPGSMVGSATKNVVIDGTAGRKFFEARLVDIERGLVGVYEYTDGGMKTSDTPKGSIGPIVRR